ncbi:hypothetical protein [Pseudomonas cremoris]|nr:hypothetical protein [Pseudomonas cremoris]
MTLLSSIGLKKLPMPPNYMQASEQNQVRQMTGPVGRPAGDHRSADRIFEQSPVLKQFLDSRDHYDVGDELKMQVGDWSTANADPDARANAAYDLDKVLRFIDNLDDRPLNGSHSRNGKIDGFFNDGYNILTHSEASVLKAFSQKGYEVLRHLPT